MAAALVADGRGRLISCHGLHFIVNQSTVCGFVTAADRGSCPHEIKAWDHNIGRKTNGFYVSFYFKEEKAI